MIWVTTMHDPPWVAATNILSHTTSTRDCQFGSPQPPWVAATRNVVMRPPMSRNNLDLSRATSTKGHRFESPQPLWVSTACDLVMQARQVATTQIWVKRIVWRVADLGHNRKDSRKLWPCAIWVAWPSGPRWGHATSGRLYLGHATPAKSHPTLGSPRRWFATTT